MRTKFSNNSFISLVSYKNLNHGALRAMLVMLLFAIGIGNAWGGTAYTRGRAFLKEGCPTGSGKVYVGGGDKSSTPGTYTQLNSYDTPVTDQKAEAQATRTYYFYAQANSGYKFTGWYKKNNDDTYTLVTTEASCSGSVTSGKDPSTPGATSYKDIDRYAEFIKIVHYSFIVPEHGSYTITNNGVEVENYATIEAEGVVHLVSLPADGYRFAGWYTTTDGGVTKNYFSFDPETDLSFSDDATIGVDFRLDNGNALFYVVNGGMHDNLTTAITEASSISPKVVTVAQDGHLASGNYTIPSGVTLLVQNNKSYDVQTKPELVKSASSLFVYRRLTMLEGANITCSGTICIAGKQVCLGGGNASGYVTGGCGVIDMSAGGHIELNNGANLYAWGFITGQDVNQGNNTSGVGTIVANSGSKVWEDFAVGDWRGGTACSSIQGSNFFPFQSYFIQNIEVPLTVKYGALDNCYASVSGDGQYLQLSATMIGTTDALFKLASGGVVRKWYDATTDLMCFELSGTANLDAVVVKGLPGIGNISSKDYYLPISSNMHIILTNSNVTISKPMTVQPGAKIEVKSDANITISSNVFLYDKEEWGPYAGPNYYFHNYGAGILTAHKNRGNGKSKDLLDDAQIIVDGQLSITGKLYSTASGADVMGNGGGHVVFSALPSSSTTIDAFTSNGDAVSGGVTVNTANLHNEDESYTKAIASTTFHNVHGRWFKSGNQNEKANHTYDFTYISSGAVSGTSGTNSTSEAVYALDKTGLEAGMKWCNVVQDGTCSNIFNATQALNETPASDIRYTYPSSEWLQLLRTETEGVYGGSDNSLYAVDGCAVNSLGSVDENCLYTIDGVKKALVDGHFVALAKNDDDEAFHNTANIEDYYISFEGCTWHPATKEVEEKAYTVEGGIYIWYSGDWKLVEREDPYFFDYNDQNVKRYYEYENGAWVLATPCVSVTDVLETRYFYFLPEAITVAFAKKNATITLLKDVASTMSQISFTAKNTTCTLDLNGHTALLTITASGNSANLFAINAANSTFTITDNSANQDGVLDITTSLKVTSTSYHTRGIAVVDGALILNAGTVRLSNTYAYTSTSNSGMIKGINVAAGKSFTMNGGAVYAESPYYPRAINVEGSTSANATVNINNGTITAHSTTETNAMGIYTIGGTLNVKPGVTINATTTTTSAYGIYVEASTNGYFGTLNMTGGTVNATGATGTAYGIFVNGVYVSNNTTPNTFGANYKAKATIAGGTFNVTTTSGKTAYGVCSRGTTTISGGDFTVAPASTTAIGVFAQDGTTTIEGNPTFDVSATEIAYGIQAGNQPVEKTGQPFNGNVIVKGGTFDVQTRSKTTAYGVYVYAGTRNTTNTASGYYPGHYVSAGKATIEGGTFNVTSKTTTAYGVHVIRATPLYDGEGNIDAYAQGEAIIKGGTFTVVGTTTASKTPTTDAIRAYGDVTITGGEFEVTAPGGYVAGLRIFDGKTTISGNPTFTVRGSTYAYGAFVTGVAPTSLGFISNAELEINNGSFDVATTGTTYAYGALVSPVVPLATADPEVFYKSPSTLTINDGHFTVTAQTTTAQGVNCSRGTLMAETLPNTLLAENLGTAYINGGTFDVSTLGTTTAQGITNSGNMTVENATFNVTSKTNTAYGARCYHGLLTINEGAEFNVEATEKAYGIVAGNEQPTTAGLLYDAEVVINGGTINVETTSKATIYGLWASRNSRTIATGTANEGNYASAGKITVNGGEINVKAKTNPAYAVFVDAVVTQAGNTDYPAATATPQAFINGGKFKVTATSSKNYAVSATPLAENCQITGGYYNTHTTQTSGTYLDKYVVSPNKKLTLRSSHALYPAGYRYTVGKGGTVTWKNGETTLLTEDYLQGDTPAYTGTPPTKTDAEYEYTHNGWDPTIADMDNSDATYSATFSQTEKKYSVSVAAGANGSVIPASVSDIGCVTASGDITAVPNTGYHFVNWTLPEGVTTADGYTASSNPIRIHATASNKTITANFEANTYTVTLDNQSATTAGESSVTATYGAAMPSIAANLPEKTGYTFDGYYSATNGGGTQYYNADGTSAHVWDIDGEITLYAKWTLSAVTVIWKNGDEVIETDEGVLIGATPSFNGEAPTKATDASNGYTFDGWSDGTNVYAADALPAVSGPVTYTAHYSTTPTVASVTVGSATTYYTDFAEAWDATNSATGAVTLKLLQDVTDIASSLVYTNAQNCTLDLNNHLLKGAVNQKLLDINKAGCTFTITDSSTEQGGELYNEASGEVRYYGVYLTAGTLNLEAGTVHAKNLKSDYSSATTAAKKCMASGVYVASGQRFNMNGGIVTGEAIYAAYGVESAGVIVINNGTINATTTKFTTARGIICTSTTTINGGTINATAKTTTAQGIYVNGGTTTVKGGEIVAKTTTTTCYGVYVKSGALTIPSASTVEISATATTNTAYGVYVAASKTATIEAGIFTVTAGTNTAAGVYSLGTTTIKGGTFDVSAASTTSTLTTVPCGIYAIRGTVTVNDNPTFNVTSGAARAYGAFAYGTIGANGKSKYSGTIKINGGTFNVTSTTTTAYGAYAGLLGKAVTLVIPENAADTIAGQHYMPGIIEITDATFNVKATTTGAYGIVVAAAKSESGAVGTTARRPTATITGGNFKVESEGDDNATAYAMNTSATATYLKVQGGKYSTKKTSASTNIEDKYTAPMKDCNYHVLDLPSSELPYKYEVAEAYKVTWDATTNGGSCGTEYTVVKNGAAIGTLPEATKTNYSFDGWYTAAAGGTTVTTTTTISATQTYYAQFTPDSYTVTLNTNGGTINAGEVTSYTYGTGATLPTDVTKDGHTFGGWFDNSGLTGDAVTTISSTATGNKEFWAKWTTAETGDYLDIVDWTASTLTINANGWTASGWPYTVNDVVYGKDKDAGQAKFRDADRTLTIPYSGVAGSELDITVKSEETVISKHKYTIPFINTVTGAGEDAFVYVSSGTLEINAASISHLTTLSIRPGASVNITNGTLAIDSLVLRTEPWQTASISGNFTATKTYYTRIAPNNRTISGPGGEITYVSANYYQFALPLTCTVAVKDIKVSHGAKTTYGKAWLLKSYSESSRAANGAGDNWVLLEEDDYIQGGVGYEMSSNSAYYREYLFPVGVVNSASLGTTTDVSYDLGAAGEKHAGWNIVGSPLMSVYDNSAADPETGLKISWLQTDGSYDQGIPDYIYPAIPFTYQASLGQTQISFAETTLKASAPRRRVTAAEEPERIQWIHLDVKDANGIGDHTSVLAHPTRYEEAYKTGIDVAKQSLTATRARLYSSHTYGDMAFAGVSDELFEQGVALTLYSPAAQELTFSLRRNDWLNRLEYVWIVDTETGAMIDLLSSDYTAQVTEGTTYGRFYISGRFHKPGIATDVENVSDSSLKGRAQKVLIEEKIYILVGDKLYDATGKLVKGK